jgi:hypothetical protein
MPSTPPSMARRASSGCRMPLTISGSSVSDRSHGRSSQVSGLPKTWAHNLTACRTCVGLEGSAVTFDEVIKPADNGELLR